MPAIDLHASPQDEHKIENAIVIVLPLEHTRPVVADTCSSPRDRERILAWVASQPELREHFVWALRRGGYDVEGLLDHVHEEDV